VREPGEEEGSDSGFVDENGVTWELDPNDPSHPDYDLSEGAGYGRWEPMERWQSWRQRIIVIVAVLLLMALLVPVLVRFLFS
jgi:hypothetical protein